MRRLLPLLSFVLLLFVSLEMMACGSGRRLQSISVSPAVADGQDFPNGLVQFTATGTFNMSPTTVTPLKVIWSLGFRPAIACPPNCVAIDSNGVGCCGGGTMGATVQASAPSDPSLPLTTPNVPMVVGTATLNCP